MNYYSEIKQELISNETHKKIKDYSKNRYEFQKYYNVGKLLLEAGKHYGDGIIKEYSVKLTKDLKIKYDVSSLNKMRKFYNLIEKVVTLSPNLSYSHYVELLPYDDLYKIQYYIRIVEEQNLSVRQLRMRIKFKEYERLPDETKNKIITEEKYKIQDLIKNPLVIKNSNNYEVISEKVLQKLILEDIPLFLKELDNGFSFIKNEYKIKLGDRYNYVDLLLYNIKFKCYVVVELKITELNSNHTGQIQKYMNYIDMNVRTKEENKTIGIIICKQDNKYVIKYCSDERVIARKYELI